MNADEKMSLLFLFIELFHVALVGDEPPQVRLFFLELFHGASSRAQLMGASSRHGLMLLSLAGCSPVISRVIVTESQKCICHFIPFA